MGADTAKEALRILRRISAKFSDGTRVIGSGFAGPEPGTVIACAHLVSKPSATLQELTVDSKQYEVKAIHSEIDLAVLSGEGADTCQLGGAGGLQVGDALMFAGFPVGVTGPSIFSGILSSRGKGLIDSLNCEVLQINGMINSWNSGGPVFETG